jgi:hypothetical protein
MRWKDWLVNRVTITFGTLAVVIFGWNLYVAANNDGYLTGVVVAPDGRPVAEAEVVLSEQTIVSLTPIARTTTDPTGRFVFGRHDRHHVVVTAQKEGIGSSRRHYIRLYFRNQNRDIEHPIVLTP